MTQGPSERSTLLEEIRDGERLIALIVRGRFEAEGIQFLTSDDASLQLGYMRRPQGHEIQPHIHKPFRRVTDGTQEVLFVKEGRVRVDFYTDQREFLESREILKDDWLMLYGAGHGFEMLEPTVMFEVKNGPYAGDADKERFHREGATP